MRRGLILGTMMLLVGLGLQEPSAASAGTPILGPALVPVTSAQKWAAERKGTATFVALAPLFWQIAPQRGGVRPEVAYAQSAKETAFGRFGGSVDPSFHNPCGMKVTAGGADGDPNAHKRFSSWEEGITACVDHLALYAGAPGYPRPDTPDPRHFSFLKGVAPTVEALGGRWAPSPDYGVSIVADYLAPMKPVPPPPTVPGSPQPPYWPTWDIARGMATGASAGGWTLDGWGGVHAWGGAPQLDRAGAPYWVGWDIAQGVLVNQNGPGGWTLDGWGGVHAWGGAPQLDRAGAPYWVGWNIARDVAVNPNGPGGWTLDGWGGVHAWGGAPQLDRAGAPYWVGWDIARGLVVRADGPGGWILDGWGGVHAFGGAPATGTTPYWAGFDNARDFVITPYGAAGPNGYTLDMWGGVHTWS